MGDTFDPDAFLAKLPRQQKRATDEPFDPDAFLRELRPSAPKPADPGSPLERALATQSGDVVTVETPTGPAQFTRTGERFYSPEESARMMDSGGARLKERALEEALTYLGSGGKLMDEMAGMTKAVNPLVHLRWLAAKAKGQQAPSPSDVYDQARAQAQRDFAAARSKSPDVAVAGLKIKPVEMAGAMTPGLLTPMAAGALGRIATGAYNSAFDELGGSDAQLTHGEVGKLAGDVAAAGATGALVSGAAEGVTAPLRWLAGKAGEQANAAKEALRDAIQAARDKAVASAQGKLGNVIMSQNNSAETVLEVLQNPQWFSENVVARAREYINSPHGRELLSRAAANNMEKLWGSIAPEEAARTVLSGARDAALPSAVASATEEAIRPGLLLSDNAKKAWKSIGQRALLAAGGSAAGAVLSEALGYDPRVGGAGGAIVGGIAPGALQFMRNRAAAPAVQYGANRIAQALLTPAAAAVEKTALVAPAAEKISRRDRLAAAYRAMMQRSAKLLEQDP